MNGIKKFFVEIGLVGKEASDTNAIKLLEADHRKVEALFNEFMESERVIDKQRLLGTILKELIAHTSAEEELVYPIIRKMAKEEADEAVEEHHVVKLFIAELAEMKATDEKTLPKVKVLSEMVEHHVKEEERSLFRKLKRSGTDLEKLGQQILQHKKDMEQAPRKATRKTSTASTKSAKKTVKRAAPNSKRKAS